MASNQAVENALQAHFAAQWQSVDRAPQVIFENEPEPEAMDALWLRFVVRYLASTYRAIGQKRLVREGVVVVQVFAPDGCGIADTNENIDRVAEILEGKTLRDTDAFWLAIDPNPAAERLAFPTIYLSAAQLDERRRRKEPDSSYYQTNVEVGFYHHEPRATNGG